MSVSEPASRGAAEPTEPAGDPRHVADAIEAEAWRDMFAAMPAPLASATRARVVDAGGAVVFVAPGIPTPFFNRAIGLGAARPATEAELDAVLAAYEPGSPFFVHTPSSDPACADLEGWLRARGLAPFAARPTWAKCLRGPEPPPEIATSLVVREADPARASELAAVIAAAHGMPPPMLPWIVALVGRPSWHTYSVMDGDAIVGGGMVYVRGDRAWLGLGATAPTHRRRGGQRALMARRVADAAALGAVTLATETGDPVGDEPNPSLANMRWCGFRRVGGRLNWTR